MLLVYTARACQAGSSRPDQMSVRLSGPNIGPGRDVGGSSGGGSGQTCSDLVLTDVMDIPANGAVVVQANDNGFGGSLPLSAPTFFAIAIAP